MTDQRPPGADDESARKVTPPSSEPPDAGLTYDPEMTEGDEANVPEGSQPHRETPDGGEPSKT